MTPQIAALCELMFAAVTTGVILVLELVLWRSKATAQARLAAALFGLAVAGYALGTTSLIGSMVGQTVWLRVPLAALVSADVGLYAVLVTSLFEDRKVTWRSFLPPLCLAALGHAVLNSRGMIQWLLLGPYLLFCLYLLVRSILTLLGGWPGDLDETRRRMRRPVVAATLLMAVSIAVDIAISTAARVGLIDSWLTLQREAAIALVAIFVACQFLTVHGLTGTPGGGHASDKDAANEVALLSLDKAMNEGEAWRMEGLTIQALSAQIDVPEYRLRRVILERLGYRNFPAYINRQRIEAAKVRMAGPGAGTIAAIAYEVGFNSLSAFNRAFRDVTGDNPTTWRRNHADAGINPGGASSSPATTTPQSPAGR